jgi:hypothetical protein
MSVQVSYKKQFLIYILLLFIVIISIEGIARSYEFSISEKCNFLDKEVFKEHNNNKLKQMCFDLNSLQVIFESPKLEIVSDQHFSTININSHGFRGSEITKEKEDNVFRIFVLGGSTIFGHGSTSDETTIPAALQEKFNEVDLSHNIEVINAGIPGGWSESEMNYIQDKLLDFDPNMFIIYDGWNDINMNNDQFNKIINKNNDKILTPIKQHETKEESGLKFKDISFYRTPTVFYRLFLTPEISSTNHYDDDRKTIIAKTWKENWSQICELGIKKNFSTVIFIQPLLGTGNKELSNDEIKIMQKDGNLKGKLNSLELLSSNLNELNKTCTSTSDLRNVFDDISDPIYFDFGHVGDNGNKIIANDIFKKILPIIVKDIQNPP